MKHDLDYINQVLGETGVKQVFTQNAKMKRSSSNGVHLYNFGIPAFQSKTGLRTCPQAGVCATGCYAKQGTYIWNTVAQAYENRLALTRTKGFDEVIHFQIAKLLKKHKTGLILLRIHDSGDFYSESYQLTWYNIAKAWLHEPRVKFYAYTKMVEQSNRLASDKPSNFRLVYSYGGKQDNLIKPDVNFNSRVFEDLSQLKTAKYVDGTHDDTVAALGDNFNIGLVYHGVKSYKNTLWNK
jgi:hypothetical protein